MDVVGWGKEEGQEVITSYKIYKIPMVRHKNKTQSTELTVVIVTKFVNETKIFC